MGLTYVDATVTGPNGKSRQLELLVDSGASYSLLPNEVWRELGLEPQETLKFFLADGTKIERQASECKIRLNGKERHTPVILGQAGDEPLLGVITLENLGFVLDPFKRTLQAMKLRLG
ncbi:MAG: aspartyl protease family protein [Planctomycetes bacterium]|nr:aspartyl protease family protein [Planctomycetota bacterium]